MSTESADPGSSAAADAVAGLMEESAGLRACAILTADGSLLAESAGNDWTAAAAELWSAAAEDGSPEPIQVHVATEEGEVYAARQDGSMAIAITDRFTLASLMFCDLRSALRGLAADRGTA